MSTYSLSFTSSNVNYLDPTPLDADPTIALLSGASLTGNGTTITSITIAGLGANDTLSLAAAGSGFTVSHSGSNWVLTIKSGTTNSNTTWTTALNALQVTSDNDPTSSTPIVEHLTFTAQDKNGNAVTLSAGSESLTIKCFYPGTMVRTPGGDVAVETLNPGDLVLTTEGVAKQVNWLGKQTVSTVFADPMRVLPIRIKAGALADNVPARDLLVSPDHALLVDGVLIQAGALVNGTSITRETRVPRVFTYYHIELDDHSLILTENAPAETFVDNVDRLGFDNWAEFEALYPEGKAVEELPYPRAKARRQVPVALRVKLADRAETMRELNASVA